MNRNECIFFKVLSEVIFIIKRFLLVKISENVCLNFKLFSFKIVFLNFYFGNFNFKCVWFFFVY